MHPDSRKQWRDAGQYSAVGLEMGIAVAMGFFAGNWADGRFGTEPWLTALGVFFGLGAAAKAVLRVYRAARRDIEAADAAEDRGEGP